MVFAQAVKTLRALLHSSGEHLIVESLILLGPVERAPRGRLPLEDPVVCYPCRTFVLPRHVHYPPHVVDEFGRLLRVLPGQDGCHTGKTFGPYQDVCYGCHAPLIFSSVLDSAPSTDKDSCRSSDISMNSRTSILATIFAGNLVARSKELTAPMPPSVEDCPSWLRRACTSTPMVAQSAFNTHACKHAMGCHYQFTNPRRVRYAPSVCSMRAISCTPSCRFWPSLLLHAGRAEAVLLTVGDSVENTYKKLISRIALQIYV